VVEADETDLYAAIDWLLKRQGQIEKKIVAPRQGRGISEMY
jgi:hypothetical protein